MMTPHPGAPGSDAEGERRERAVALGPPGQPWRIREMSKMHVSVKLLTVLAAVFLIAGCGSAHHAQGTPARVPATTPTPETLSQSSCQLGLAAARSFNAPLASHDAATTAAAAQKASGALTYAADAPYGTLSGAVRAALAQEAGAAYALGQGAQTIEYGSGQYPWSFMSSYMAQVASAVQALAAACRHGGQVTPPPGTAPSVPAPASQPAASYPTPTPEHIGPPGCPGSARLMAAWNAAPASSFRSQDIAQGVSISGFNDISCWRGWVVTSPIANANGTAEFSESGGLHLMGAAQLRQFNSAVCSSPDSPAAWKNPVDGPAICSP